MEEYEIMLLVKISSENKELDIFGIAESLAFNVEGMSLEDKEYEIEEVEFKIA